MGMSATPDASRNLAEEKAKSDALLNSIGEGVIGYNDGGEVTFVNRQTLVMLGYTQEEMVGRPVFHTIKLEDESGKEIAVNQRPSHIALSTAKRFVSTDLVFVRKNGTKFPAAITASPIVLGKRIIGGVSVFRDITLEKQIDRMKTEFISLASHQLRTPLSAIKWFSEMLIDGDVGSLTVEQREIANNIYQSNERMIELVNALLNISRIESGRIIIEPEPTDLGKLVSEVVTELTPKLKEKMHNLVVSVHKDLPVINVDRKLVRNVYMNLLTNAIKYTPAHGEITVVISKTPTEVVSQVSDNGYGIPQSQQSQVFKRFFRADNIVNKVTDGTGLGLYLVDAIVKSSGGKIWFRSEEGKGTSFWFTLPISGTPPKEGEVSIDS
jgi:PAS domain S-box-containing protein